MYSVPLTWSKKRRGRRGATLGELLVVVAAVAWDTVAAYLFPDRRVLVEDGTYPG